MDITPQHVDLRKALQQMLLAHQILHEHQRPCQSQLSLPHAWTLMALLEHPSLTISSLTDHLQIDRSNVSRLCIRMEKNGELVRTPDPSDKRITCVELTPKGKEIAESLLRASDQHFLSICARLRPHTEQIIDALKALTAAINDASGEGREGAT